MQILLTTLALLLLLAAPVPSAASIGGGAPLVTAGNPLQSHRRFGPFQTSAGAPDFAAAVDKELDQLLQKFLELPSADSNREFVFDLTRQPHIAGRENLTAQYVQEKFASFGLRSWMVGFGHWWCLMSPLPSLLLCGLPQCPAHLPAARHRAIIRPAGTLRCPCQLPDRSQGPDGPSGRVQLFPDRGRVPRRPHEQRHKHPFVQRVLSQRGRDCRGERPSDDAGRVSVRLGSSCPDLGWMRPNSPFPYAPVDLPSQLVYVNYGMIEDYEELERLGVSLEVSCFVSESSLHHRCPGA